MKIANIILTDFGIYKDVNSISFTPFSDKNISIIAGKNGYGKTTFLTSLIWVFYGKLMAQVEDKYRRDIKNYGGYDFFLKSLMNRDQRMTGEGGFSVEVELTDLMIPSIPCEKVNIKRSFDLVTGKEELSILIDGAVNELTNNVGYDVFINDFILPREIAKFFFFDAEKIVSLAEAQSKEELRSLSKAYSEVLGIKKYEELKKNLETLLTKLRRNGVSGLDKTKLDALVKTEKELSDLIEINIDKQSSIEQEILTKVKSSDDIQEKLIREGNSITVEELKEIKERKEGLLKESSEIKSKLNKLMELAPLVMAGKKLVQLRDQLKLEQNITDNTTNVDVIKKEMESFSKAVLKNLDKGLVSKEGKKEVENAFKATLKEKYQDVKKENNTKILIGFNEEQYLNFEAVYSNIKGAYVHQLNAIVQEEKNNKVLLSGVTKKIKQAEARKNNAVVKVHRADKAKINESIEELKAEKELLLISLGEYKVKIQTVRKELSEYEKNFNLVATDEKKYKVTETLLSKITELIDKVKQEKRYALQKSLKLGLSKLMHKANFIGDVKVNINEDIMDIDLIDNKGNVINKDTLSKGEQQLYATALLKALVDESGIEFPVFIDSPLQKFDKHHSQNIIQEFYPSISNQVVLLPLLEKELTEEEFILLQPNLNKTLVINNSQARSSIEECDLKEVFKELREHVY